VNPNLGNWKADRRYQMTFSFRNPSKAALSLQPLLSSPSYVSMGSIDSSSRNATSSASMPILWVAPVTHTVYSYSEISNIQSAAFSVRGNKYGAACPVRSELSTAMSSMVDLCTEATSFGMTYVNSSTTDAECLSYIQSIKSSSSSSSSSSSTVNTSTWPFIAPPITSYSLQLSTNATACSANNASTVYSSRYGECISCGLYGNASSTVSCTCPTSTVLNRAGAVACGSYRDPAGNSTTTASLVTWLCSSLTAKLQDFREKRYYAGNAMSQLLQSFLDAAATFTDWAAVKPLVDEYTNLYSFDQRYPESPTRAAAASMTGFVPAGFQLCQRCGLGGGVLFKNVQAGYQGSDPEVTTGVYDDKHFAAMHTFRAVGYALYRLTGSSCTALWDPEDPERWDYGYFEAKICKAMPTGTSGYKNFYGLANFTL